MQMSKYTAACLVVGACLTWLAWLDFPPSELTLWVVLLLLFYSTAHARGFTRGEQYRDTNNDYIT
jgi:hypothetical protein